MPKIGFKRLSRGVKLLTSHIHTQIGAALTRVTSTRVAQDNLERGDAVTRMTFSWPSADNRQLGGTAPQALCALFILPGTQEIFRSDGVSDPQDPKYVLDSVSFSFDSRGEAAAINDVSAGPPVPEGSLNFSKAAQVAFKLQIHEKRMSHFGGEVGGDFEGTVLSIDYPNLGFNNTQSRTNPQVREQLGILLSPYKSYILALSCADYLGADTLIANSILVTLTLKSPLRLRDSGASSVQNIPQSPDLPNPADEYGGPFVDPQTILTPGAGAVIVAAKTGTDEGVQGAMEKMDISVRPGLSGGYNEKSRRPAIETLLNDAAYEVIAVPMWGNGWYVGTPATSNYAALPYVGAAFDQSVVDRRIVPLHFPFVVHHVVSFMCYTGGSAPSTATYSYGVGVGIGTGIRADSYGYRQVAYATWDNAAKTTYQIDSFSESLVSGGLAGDLFNIPLVGTGGAGFAPVQGLPFFAGRTDNPDVVRSPAANAPGGAPVAIATIDGKEQWLEVRMQFRDTAGINNLPGTDNLVGYGGHWVYIIGKKHSC